MAPENPKKFTEIGYCEADSDEVMVELIHIETSEVIRTYLIPREKFYKSTPTALLDEKKAPNNPQ